METTKVSTQTKFGKTEEVIEVTPDPVQPPVQIYTEKQVDTYLDRAKMALVETQKTIDKWQARKDKFTK